ncbi:MAG: hypothetical protein KDH92_04625 [Chloroflexi bacterium]|nr:hypothetical protein [Chloroflexota bacterium]
MPLPAPSPSNPYREPLPIGPGAAMPTRHGAPSPTNRRRASRRSAGARLAGGLALLGLGWAWLGAEAPAVRAQAEPSLAPAEARLLFAPLLGTLDLAVDGPEPRSEAGRYAGLRVQNVGERPGRFLVYYLRARGEGGRPFAMTEDPPDRRADAPSRPAQSACSDCVVVGARCSPEVAPGGVWTFPPGLDAEGSAPQAATIYSLNTRPAADYGAEWAAWLLDHDLPADTSLAEAVCGQATVVDDAAPTCDRYLDFHRAFLSGTPTPRFGAAPFEALRGEPIAAVAAARVPTIDQSLNPSLDRPALDRYAALRLAETQYAPAGIEASQPFTRSYLLPGLYTRTLEGRLGFVSLQNTDTECASVVLEGFPTGSGQLETAGPFAIAPGAVLQLRLADLWRSADPITVRASSQRALAVVGSNLGYHVSAAFPAIADHWDRSAWAIPRAYQEPKPIPGGRSVIDASLRLLAAEGRETNISVFNAGAEQGAIAIDTQALGKPARSVTVLVDPLLQNVYQLGFGLGSEGGPGWARFTPAADLQGRIQPFAAAFESFRMATDVPAPSEIWAAPAWPVDLMTEGQAADASRRGPAAIALPDLAGPAVGPLAGIRPVAPNPRLTDALTSRIAVQSLAEGGSRVAIDLYAPRCGFVGSLEQRIDRTKTWTLEAGELPGAAHGVDQAVLRVLEGQVAAMVETTRETQQAIGSAPPDLSTAYLGLPLREAFLPPALETAMLAVAPARIDLAAPTAVVTASLRIEDALASGRCLSVVAESDAEWLTVLPRIGAIPGDLVLTIDPARIPAGEGPAVADVTLRAVEPSVLDSPRVVRVQVERPGPPAPPPIYLPTLLRAGAGPR